MESPHREGLMYRPTSGPLNSADVRDAKAAIQEERHQRMLAKERGDLLSHRAAPAHSKERLSSWSADQSSAQSDFERRRMDKNRKASDLSKRAQEVDWHRANRKNKAKQDEFERSRMMEQKVKRQQRGIAGEVDLSTKRKELDHQDWEEAIRAGRTEARKVNLMTGGVKKKPPTHRPSVKIEEDSTHRRLGHLTDAEIADYGMIEGETLDEEGRVVPPWVGRADRYAGPIAEDEMKYPFDYGYGKRGDYEKSNGKMPPPQLFIKDRKVAPRRDPDLYAEVAPYVPYGDGQPGPFSPTNFTRGFGPDAAAIAAYDRAAYGYGYAAGYGYGFPPPLAYNHPVYGPSA